MIAPEIEALFADVFTALLPGRSVWASQSRTDTLDDLDMAVIVEAAPEEAWLRDARGKVQGWRVPLSIHVLGYTEAIAATGGAAAFRALCSEAGGALRDLTDEELHAALPQAYALSGYEDADNADRGAEEGYDRWTATMNLYIIVTNQESAS